MHTQTNLKVTVPGNVRQSTLDRFVSLLFLSPQDAHPNASQGYSPAKRSPKHVRQICKLAVFAFVSLSLSPFVSYELPFFLFRARCPSSSLPAAPLHALLSDSHAGQYAVSLSFHLPLQFSAFSFQSSSPSSSPQSPSSSCTRPVIIVTTRVDIMKTSIFSNHQRQHHHQYHLLHLRLAVVFIIFIIVKILKKKHNSGNRRKQSHSSLGAVPKQRYDASHM
jgi:hypothetical protein